eukprot:7381744-Prymnesium_polylepis.2
MGDSGGRVLDHLSDEQLRLRVCRKQLHRDEGRLRLRAPRVEGRVGAWRGAGARVKGWGARGWSEGWVCRARSRCVLSPRPRRRRRHSRVARGACVSRAAAAAHRPVVARARIAVRGWVVGGGVRGRRRRARVARVVQRAVHLDNVRVDAADEAHAAPQLRLERLQQRAARGGGGGLLGGDDDSGREHAAQEIVEH